MSLRSFEDQLWAEEEAQGRAREASLRLPPWVFECRGRARPGDSAGMGQLHVWRREPDGTATCKKCGVVLTVEEAVDCFAQR